jgi:transaldolase
MTIKVFADGADRDGIIEAAGMPNVVGFTTNPTLMRQAGETDYKAFARSTIQYLSKNRPKTCLSLEVFADDHDGMVRQARIIDSWGDEFDYDVYVKIPVTYTNGASTADVLKHLALEGIKLNVTAVFTLEQVEDVLRVVDRTQPTIVSIFAGRIADAGLDPISVIDPCLEYWADTMAPPEGKKDLVEFLWASCREPYNVVTAYNAGVDIITMPLPMIKKMSTFGKDLTEFSLETVRMFYNDALASGFTIEE